MGWAVATPLTMAGHGRLVAPFWVLAAVAFGYGAYLAAAARDEHESSHRRAQIEGLVWGIAALCLLLAWFTWVPPSERLGNPGEVNEVWIDPHAPRENHAQFIQFSPALEYAVQTLVIFGLVGGLLSGIVRLGRCARSQPIRIVGSGLAWALAMILVTYPMVLAIYLLPAIMSRQLHPTSAVVGIFFGGALAGAIGGVIAGAIGESLTSGLRRRVPFPASQASSPASP